MTTTPDPAKSWGHGTPCAGLCGRVLSSTPTDSQDETYAFEETDHGRRWFCEECTHTQPPPPGYTPPPRPGVSSTAVPTPPTKETK